MQITEKKWIQLNSTMWWDQSSRSILQILQTTLFFKNVTYLSIQLQYLILGLETHVFFLKKLDQKHKLDDLLATLSPAHFTLYFSVGPHPSLILTLSFS